MIVGGRTAARLKEIAPDRVLITDGQLISASMRRPIAVTNITSRCRYRLHTVSDRLTRRRQRHSSSSWIWSDLITQRSVTLAAANELLLDLQIGSGAAYASSSSLVTVRVIAASRRMRHDRPHVRDAREAASHEEKSDRGFMKFLRALLTDCRCAVADLVCGSGFSSKRSG